VDTPRPSPRTNRTRRGQRGGASGAPSDVPDGPGGSAAGLGGGRGPTWMVFAGIMSFAPKSFCERPLACASQTQSHHTCGTAVVAGPVASCCLRLQVFVRAVQRGAAGHERGPRPSFMHPREGISRTLRAWAIASRRSMDTVASFMGASLSSSSSWRISTPAEVCFEVPPVAAADVLSSLRQYGPHAATCTRVGGTHPWDLRRRSSHQLDSCQMR